MISQGCENFGVYVHIPYCRRICPYCDFNVHIARRADWAGLAQALHHELEELDRIADDATVMRDGRVVGAAPFKDLTRDQIVRMMVGREVSELYARTTAAPGREALSVRGLCLRRVERSGEWLLRDIGFSVSRGEVLGIFGLMGAGRTELLETLLN